jgi:hypothetical protein
MTFCSGKSTYLFIPGAALLPNPLQRGQLASTGGGRANSLRQWEAFFCHPLQHLQLSCLCKKKKKWLNLLQKTLKEVPTKARAESAL